MSSEKSLTPQIRFKGFTEAWEQCKLGNLAIFNPNADLPAQFEYVDLESVAGTEMLSHRTELRDSAPSRAQRLAQFGDLFYQTVRPYQKNNYLYEKPDNNYVFSTGYAQMRPLVDGYFLLSLVQNEGFIKKVLDNCSGTSYPAINANVLSSIVVNSSSHRKEQIQIGCLFRRIDNLITLHQRKLDALKKIKSALLEKMFPKDGSNIPEIRFAGYTEAWEQHKLGDYGFVQMCRRIYKDQTSEVGDVPFFKIGTFGSQPDAFISRSLFQDYRKQYPFPSVGTTLISAAGSIGRTIIYQGEEAYFQDSNIVWLDNNEKLNNVFLNSLYKKIDWKLEGSTIKRLYNKDILNAEVCVPSTIEQCQVGSFFARLDSLITLHQRKLDALKKIKSALLEKMFV